MLNSRLKLAAISLCLASAATLILAAPAFALTGQSDSSLTLPLALADKKASRSANRANQCQKRKAVASKRLQSRITQVDKHLADFDVKVSKVDQFYLQKLVSQGKIISNYDALKSGINTASASAKAAKAALQADTASVTCDKGSQETDKTKFKTDLQTMIKALQDYRVAVKNFVAAVKTVARKSTGTTAGNTTGQ